MARWILSLLVATAVMAGTALAEDAAKEGKKKQRRQPPSVEDIFNKLDKDDDGKVTEEEFLAGRRASRNPERAKAFFKKIAGEDGVMTFDELKAAREKMKQRREAAKRQRGEKKADAAKKPGDRKPKGEKKECEKPKGEKKECEKK